MEKSGDNPTRGQNSNRSHYIPPEERFQILEPLRPFCACGCGERLDIPVLYKRCTIDYVLNTYWKQYSIKQNHRIKQSVADKISVLEPLRPLCACGCGRKLEIPAYLLNHGASVKRILDHWSEHPNYHRHGGKLAAIRNRHDALEPLSSETLGRIYGTLLGDGSICYPHANSLSPRVSWTHGIDQEDWLRHKCQLIPELVPKIEIAPNKGYGETSIRARTLCHPNLREVYTVVRPDSDRKRVTSDWLNRISEEGLAWWYMDDGSLNHTSSGAPSITLHTEGYSKAENQLLQQWLESLGYSASIWRIQKQGKIYHALGLTTISSRKWVEFLCQYAIPAMAYKFNLC